MNNPQPWRLETPPDDALVRRFARRFEGFADAYGSYDPDTARPETPDKIKVEIKSSAYTKKKPPTFDLWRKHLQGVSPLGIIPIRRDNSCVWGCIDIDFYSVNVIELMQRITEHEYPLIACGSKSGGVHLFAFMAEPIPASLMQLRLREMAANLGWGGSEIFPKQSTVNWDAGDYGGWLNMPFFGRTRASYRENDGTAVSITLEEFLDLADRHEQPAASFRDDNERSFSTGQGSPDFADGPPCLEHLSGIGFPEGGRNTALLNMATFAKKKYGDDWETTVENWNRDLMHTPLPDREVKDIVRRLKVKNYFYECKKHPLVTHCNSMLCRTRQFGVGDGEATNKRGKTEDAFTPDEAAQWRKYWIDKIANAPAGKEDDVLLDAIWGMGNCAAYIKDIDQVERELGDAWRSLRGSTPESAQEFSDAFARTFSRATTNAKPLRWGKAEGIFVSYADVKPEDPKWLWEERIPLGKLTILAGDPDTLKSQITMNIAATVSTGGEWPFGEGKAKKGRVLILSAEDTLADTAVPRLMAAGGDRGMVTNLRAVRDHPGSAERTVDLNKDLELIDYELGKRNDYTLVVLDPMSAYMGKDLDAYRDTEVRAFLEPLGRLAEKHGVAIVAIAHLNKTSGRKAIMAILGSVGLAAAARAIYLAAREPIPDEEDGSQGTVETGRFFLATIRVSNAPSIEGRTMVYEQRSKVVEEGLKPAPFIEWVDKNGMSANELTGYRQGAKPGRPAEQYERAKRLLEKLLLDGTRVPEKEIEAAAKEAKISMGTMKKALKGLEGTSKKQGFHHVWYIPWVEPEIPF